MRRTLALLPLLLLPVAGAQAVPVEPVERPPLRATLTTCATGPGVDERYAVFTGSMPALRRTERMSMRFEVQRREPGGKRFVRVRGPKLGRWERSEPDRAGFVWSKRVEPLDAGAAYRAVVRFRWHDAEGDLQRSAERTTAVCVQPAQTAEPGELD
jgi:hypothetical protein